MAASGTAAALAYRAAPGFWQQYSKEMRRNIIPSSYVPEWRAWPSTGVHAAWLGHSSVLLKIDGVHILTDPVFSDRCGISLGLVTLGLKRRTAPALRIPELPPIDLILLSHAHMDHFDIPSLRRLESKGTRVVTARETSDLLRPGRYQHVRELGWGEKSREGEALIQGVEVNHWGARMRTDTYRGYNGYLIEVGTRRVLFAGDTADTSTFRQLHSRRPIDLAVMPIGAYDPWIRYHCTPEQAWRMGNEAGSEYLLPVHHQTFELSREHYLEPISRFLDAAGSNPGRVALQEIGQSFSLG
ncbi:MAG: MBL fold metallo-hydrolase [Bryobacteraceae bacterium]|nr:MBL fold metallo-hydrolase [Bryobacteraceae bacterium]